GGKTTDLAVDHALVGYAYSNGPARPSRSGHFPLNPHCPRPAVRGILFLRGESFLERLTMRTRNLVFAVLVFTLVIAPAGWSQRKPSAPPAVSGEKKEEGGPSLIGGKTLSAWVQDLKSKDPSVVENAIRTIMMFTPAQWETEQTLVPSLTRHVGASDYSSRVNAAMALGM